LFKDRDNKMLENTCHCVLENAAIIRRMVLILMISYINEYIF
jgi:hypothetical protein